MACLPSEIDAALRAVQSITLTAAHIGAYANDIVRPEQARFAGGAAGDGVADDAPAIQAAIDYVSGIGGGAVYLKSGSVYALAAGLINKPGVRLCADGEAKATLKATGVMGSMVSFEQNTDNLAVCNILFDAARKVSGPVIFLEGNHNWNVSGNEIINAAQGIYGFSTFDKDAPNAATTRALKTGRLVGNLVHEMKVTEAGGGVIYPIILSSRSYGPFVEDVWSQDNKMIGNDGIYSAQNEHTADQYAWQGVINSVSMNESSFGGGENASAFARLSHGCTIVNFTAVGADGYGINAGSGYRGFELTESTTLPSSSRVNVVGFIPGNPSTVITETPHPFTANSLARFFNVGGVSQLENGDAWEVLASVDATSFTIDADSTGWGASFTSGGNCGIAIVGPTRTYASGQARRMVADTPYFLGNMLYVDRATRGIVEAGDTLIGPGGQTVIVKRVMPQAMRFVGGTGLNNWQDRTKREELILTNTTGTFVKGEQISAPGGKSGIVAKVAVAPGGNVSIDITSSTLDFAPNDAISGINSGASGTMVDVNAAGGCHVFVQNAEVSIDGFSADETRDERRIRYTILATNSTITGSIDSRNAILNAPSFSETCDVTNFACLASKRWYLDGSQVNHAQKTAGGVVNPYGFAFVGGAGARFNVSTNSSSLMRLIADASNVDKKRLLQFILNDATLDGDGDPDGPGIIPMANNVMGLGGGNGAVLYPPTKSADVADGDIYVSETAAAPQVWIWQRKGGHMGARPVPSGVAPSGSMTTKLYDDLEAGDIVCIQQP